MNTANIPEIIISETYVCRVCEGKYGNKLIDKLNSLDIKFNHDSNNNKEIKPFHAKIEYSGGTKEDITNIVCSIIDQEEIYDEVKFRMGWFG